MPYLFSPLFATRRSPVRSRLVHHLSTSMSVGDSILVSHESWLVLGGMRNRVMASNPRPPKNYAAIIRKAGGSGIQLRVACRRKDIWRQSDHRASGSSAIRKLFWKGCEKFSWSAKSGYNKGTVRSDIRYLVISKDVRRHRLISISYISRGPCHGRGREFESRRPRHSF